MSKLLVRTAKSMDVTYPAYVQSQRTTLCDVMCTSNSAMPLMELPTPPEKLRPLLATLPYEKIPLVGPMKATTKFQKFKVDGNKTRIIEELKKERLEFLEKIKAEKDFLDMKKSRSTIKIQAAFRGYKIRRKRRTYIPKKKFRSGLSQNEIQDDLCKMAVELKLKPIAGLNLEWRTKASKRKIKIEYAAAYRIQRFFKMITARNLAKVVVQSKRIDYLNQQAKVITRAIVYMKTKNFAKRVDAMKRERSAIKIQAQLRKFQAQARVRLLRKQKLIEWKRTEAAIIIQRNLSARHRRMGKFAQITLVSLRSVRKVCMLVEDRIISIIIDSYVKSCLDNYILLWEKKFVPALKEAESRCVDQELNSYIDDEVTALVDITSRKIDEDRRKMLELQKEEEETVRMMAEEGLIRMILDVARVVEASINDISVSESANVLEEVVAKEILKVAQEAEAEITPPEPEPEIREPEVETKVEDEYEADYEPDYEELDRKVIEEFAVEAVMEIIDTVLQKVAADIQSKMMIEDIKSALATTQNEPADLLTASHVEANSFEPGISMIDSAIIVDDPVVKVDSESDQKSVTTTEAVNQSAETVREIIKMLAQGKFSVALDISSNSCDKVDSVIQDMDNQDESLPTSSRKMKLLVLTTVLKLLKARALFSIAEYLEAKTLLEEVMKNRIELLGSNHYLVGECTFYLAEWYRAKAMYSESEAMYLRADKIFIEKIQAYPDLPPSVLYADMSKSGDMKKLNEKSLDLIEGAKDIIEPLSQETDRVEDEVDEKTFQFPDSELGNTTEKRLDRPLSSGKKLSHTIFKLYHRNMIAYTDLLRQCGQYYKSYHLLKTIQQNLLYYKELGYQSFEVREEFIVNLIHFYTLRGKYSTAISLHQELLDKRRVHYGLQHPKIASSYYMLGKLYLLRANYSQAIQYIEDALAMRSTYYSGHNHPAIAQTHILKADGFANLGNFKAAIQEIQIACQLYQRIFDNNQDNKSDQQLISDENNFIHPSITYSVFKLYHMYQELGECKLAHDAYQQLQQDYHLVFYANADLHVHYLELQFQHAYNELFHYQNVLYSQDVFLELIEKREMILQIFHSTTKEEKEYVQDENPTKTTTSSLPLDLELMKLYYLYSQMHTLQIMDIRKNLQFYIKKIMQIMTNQNVGVSHCMMLLGEICKYCGNYADAKTLANMAYDIILQVHGEDHPMACWVLLECADNLRIPGYYQEAMMLHTQIWRLLPTMYPNVLADANPSNPSNIANNMEKDGTTEIISSNMLELSGSVYSATCEIGSTISSVQQPQTASTIPLKPLDHYHYAYALYYRGLLLRDQQEITLAEQCFLQSIHILLLKTHENCGVYSRVLGGLGDVYRIQRKFDSSERILLLAMSIAKNNFGIYSIMYIEIVMCYVWLCMDTQRWQLAFENWVKHILPTLESLFGANSSHPWLLYGRVQMQLCKSMMELIRDEKEVEEDEKNRRMQRNVTTTTTTTTTLQGKVMKGLREHSSTQQFLHFWETSGFANHHPWYRQVQQYITDEQFYTQTLFFESSIPYAITNSAELVSDSYSLSLTLSKTKKSMESDFDPCQYVIGGHPSVTSESYVTPEKQLSQQQSQSQSQQSQSQEHSQRLEDASYRSGDGNHSVVMHEDMNSDAGTTSIHENDHHHHRQAAYDSTASYASSYTQPSGGGGGVESSSQSEYQDGMEGSSYSTGYDSYDHSQSRSHSLLQEASYRSLREGDGSTASYTTHTSHTSAHHLLQSTSLYTPSHTSSFQSPSMSMNSFRSPQHADSRTLHHHHQQQQQQQEGSQFSADYSASIGESPRSIYSQRSHTSTSISRSIVSKLINIEESTVGSWERSYVSSQFDGDGDGGEDSYYTTDMQQRSQASIGETSEVTYQSRE